MIAVDIMRQMHVEGQQRWPSISVTLEELQRHWDWGRSDSSQYGKVSEFAAEIYLCCACAGGNPLALSIFKREFEDVVRSAIARIQREPTFAEDTLQEFWKKLFVGPNARVRTYFGRSPFEAWLRLCATRLAIDRQRASSAVAERETELRDCLADEVVSPESALMQLRFYRPFQEAFGHAISSISLKERNVLRMHLLEHCSIDEIGRAYNVHRATVARWLDRARKRVLESVRSELRMAAPHLTDSEFQSVAKVLGEELTIGPSVFASRALRGSPPAPR